MNADRRLLFLVVAALPGLASLGAAEIPLKIEARSEVAWRSAKGISYQVQFATRNEPLVWVDLGAKIEGDGTEQRFPDPDSDGTRTYRVLQVEPGVAPASTALVNGGFETGNGPFATNWKTAGNRRPTRTSREAHGGAVSMHCKLANVGRSPHESLLWQSVRTAAGAFEEGSSYRLSFWTKPVSSGPTFARQYQVQWLDATRGALGSSRLIDFKVTGTGRDWVQTKSPHLVAPAGAADVVIKFRFVTGAVADGHGELYLDDVAFGSVRGTHSEATQSVEAKSETKSRITWPTKKGWIYQPFSTTIDKSGARSSLVPQVVGDGSLGAMHIAPELAAELTRMRGARMTLLPVGEVSVGDAVRGGLGLTWKANPNPRATYLVLHGRERDLLSKSIKAGEKTNATIPNVISGEPHYFAILAVRTPPPLQHPGREVPIAPPSPPPGR